MNTCFTFIVAFLCTLILNSFGQFDPVQSAENYYKVAFSELSQSEMNSSRLNNSLVSVQLDSTSSSRYCIVDRNCKASDYAGIVFYSDTMIPSYSAMPPQLRTLCSAIDLQLSDDTKMGVQNEPVIVLAKRLAGSIPDSVEPLIRTCWHQNWPYNALCPEKTG